MHMRYLLLFGFLALCACSDVKDSSTNVLDTVGNETDKSYNKIREMTGLSHPAPPKGKPAQPRYCYKTFEDFICYGKPLPGQDERLVGYQDAAGHTGYVMPPNGIMVGDMPPLKAVTVGAPPTVLGSATVPSDKPKKKLKEITFDPSEIEPKELVPAKQE